MKFSKRNLNELTFPETYRMEEQMAEFHAFLLTLKDQNELVEDDAGQLSAIYIEERYAQRKLGTSLYRWKDTAHGNLRLFLFVYRGYVFILQPVIRTGMTYDKYAIRTLITEALVWKTSLDLFLGTSDTPATPSPLNNSLKDS